ncbi:MAG: hypothetical protein IJW46_00825 [Clostridia bacterium]|nr:hypothetical protein [Clostridia bacterium]
MIKKAVAKTVSAFADRTPRIYQHFFYGAFDLAPEYLVIWYLFETDDELNTAQEIGLCAEIDKTTIRNLISYGYPEEAVETIDTSSKPYTVSLHSKATENEITYIRTALHNRRAHVSFTTKEDIDRQTNGDYHLYFG